jgi:hypothetical protein
MSKSNSISAAIRRRGGNVVSNTEVDNRTASRAASRTTPGTTPRLTYMDILKTHELRLRDIEELMKETLLITQDEQSNKILQLEETINNLTSELKLMNEKQESNNNDENNNMDNSDNE